MASVRSIIAGKTASIDWATPTKFTSSVWRSVDVSSSGTSVSEPTPAQATRTSNWPEFGRETIDRGEQTARSVTSTAAVAIAVAPSFLSVLHELGQTLGVAIDQTERHPLLARAMAVARPIP